MMVFPLAVPVDGYAPRKASVEQIALPATDTTMRRTTVLLIELQSEAEVTAVTDWIGNRMPPMPYGGPI